MHNKYKWSRFNFLVETMQGSRFLYNSYSNALVKLDKDIFYILKNIEGKFLSFDIAPAGLSEDEFDYFKKIYAFVENDDDLVEILHYSSLNRLYNRKIMVLTIAPTSACNFACTYCFEKNRKSTVITDSTIDSLIEYLKKEKQSYGLETINLNWYGGEPLLAYKQVTKIARMIRDLDLQISENYLITNGYYLTSKVIKELADSGIKTIQITLDGSKEDHDERRPLVNGKGTFDKIVENLDNLFNSKFKESFRIAIRVNVDSRNIIKFIKIQKWLKSRYPADNWQVYPGIIVLNETDENASQCLKRNEVTDFLLNMYKNHGILADRLYPEDINMECMARSPYSNMIIGSEGEIYKCFEELGVKEKIVGNINNLEIIDNYVLTSRYVTGIDHYNNAECRKCKYLPICHGGCPIRRYENVYEGKSNDCCTAFKDRIEDYISILEECNYRY